MSSAPPRVPATPATAMITEPRSTDVPREILPPRARCTWPGPSSLPLLGVRGFGALLVVGGGGCTPRWWRGLCPRHDGWPGGGSSNPAGAALDDGQRILGPRVGLRPFDGPGHDLPDLVEGARLDPTWAGTWVCRSGRCNPPASPTGRSRSGWRTRPRGALHECPGRVPPTLDRQGRRGSAERHRSEGVPLVHLGVTVDDDQLCCGDTSLSRSRVKLRQDAHDRLDWYIARAVGHRHVRREALGLLRHLAQDVADRCTDGVSHRPYRTVGVPPRGSGEWRSHSRSSSGG